jgi:hypothetical protein
VLNMVLVESKSNPCSSSSSIMVPGVLSPFLGLRPPAPLPPVLEKPLVRDVSDPRTDGCRDATLGGPDADPL